MQNYNQYYNPNFEIKPEYQEYQDNSSRRYQDNRHSTHDNRNLRERGRSRSRSPINRDSKPKFDSNQTLNEPPDWDLRTDVCLDWFNSDLTLEISPSGFEAKSLEAPGFETIWAGVRATYGIKSGRCYFEVRIQENLRVAPSGGPGSVDNVARVGWSINRSGFALGEEPLSYGYGGTAKKSTDMKFANYGQPYGPGDVIGAYCEYSYRNVIISFSKNGMPLGVAYQVSHIELEEAALFPHVYVKNVRFEVNFGQHPPWFPPPDPNWCQIGQIPLEYRIRGYRPPRTLADCEILMMCGIPASGKTVWAENRMRDMPEKNYTILGTNLILEKMKVMGLYRKANYRERWDTLFQVSNNCLTKLLQLAPKRKRNYILDQTNVYASAQNRKMKPFEGFRRVAVVMIPPDHVLEQRKLQAEKEEGKVVPEDSILDMKGNFSIPRDDSNVFDEIIFPELGREEAEELVKLYNDQGRHKVKRPGGNFGNNPNHRNRNESFNSAHSDNSSSANYSKTYSSQSSGNDYKSNDYRDTSDKFNREPSAFSGQSSGRDFNRASQDTAPPNFGNDDYNSNSQRNYGRNATGPSGDNRNQSRQYPDRGCSSSNYDRNCGRPASGAYDQKPGGDYNRYKESAYGAPHGCDQAYRDRGDTGRGGSDSSNQRGYSDRGRGPPRGAYNSGPRGFSGNQYGDPNRPPSDYQQQLSSHSGGRYENYGGPPPPYMKPHFQPGNFQGYGAPPPVHYPPFTGPFGGQPPPNQFCNTPNAPHYGNQPAPYYGGGYR